MPLSASRFQSGRPRRPPRDRRRGARRTRGGDRRAGGEFHVFDERAGSMCSAVVPRRAEIGGLVILQITMNRAVRWSRRRPSTRSSRIGWRRRRRAPDDLVVSLVECRARTGRGGAAKRRTRNDVSARRDRGDGPDRGSLGMALLRRRLTRCVIGIDATRSLRGAPAGLHQLARPARGRRRPVVLAVPVRAILALAPASRPSSQSRPHRLGSPNRRRAFRPARLSPTICGTENPASTPPTRTSSDALGPHPPRPPLSASCAPSAPPDHDPAARPRRRPRLHLPTHSRSAARRAGPAPHRRRRLRSAAVRKAGLGTSTGRTAAVKRVVRRAPVSSIGTLFG